MTKDKPLSVLNDEEKGNLESDYLSYESGALDLIDKTEKAILEKVEKIIDECANRTDIWDNERYPKFKKLIKQKLRGKK